MWLARRTSGISRPVTQHFESYSLRIIFLKKPCPNRFFTTLSMSLPERAPKLSSPSRPLQTGYFVQPGPALNLPRFSLSVDTHPIKSRRIGKWLRTGRSFSMRQSRLRSDRSLVENPHAKKYWPLASDSLEHSRRVVELFRKTRSTKSGCCRTMPSAHHLREIVERLNIRARFITP